MAISRKSVKRVIGRAIDRAVREVEGARVGHIYLQQHQMDAVSARQAIGLRDRKLADSEGLIGRAGGAFVGGAIDLTGIFVLGVTGLENPNERFGG